MIRIVNTEGKKVSFRLCQQIAVPNHYNKSKFCLYTFVDCFHLQCPFDDPSQAQVHSHGYT